MTNASSALQVELKLPDLNCAYSWAPGDLLNLTERLGRNKDKGISAKEAQSATPEELDILRDFLTSSSADPSASPDHGVVAFLHLLTSLLPSQPSYPPLQFTVTSAIPLGAGPSRMITKCKCLEIQLLEIFRNCGCSRCFKMRLVRIFYCNSAQVSGAALPCRSVLQPASSYLPPGALI